MTKIEKIVIASIMAILSLGIVFTFQAEEKAEAPTPVETNEILGGEFNVFDELTTSSRVFVGTSATKVATSSNFRQYLEIFNISGATSTAQAVYCTTGSAPATYSGWTINASSSIRFSPTTGIPTSDIYCIAPVGTAAVTVVAK